MADVVGIRFKRCGKVYDFDVDGLEVAKGDVVIVESELGLSMGSVVVERHTLAETAKELKKVLRKATEEDLKQKSENKFLEEEAMAYCLERIMARGLPMKMVCTEVTLDKKRLIFYFTADGRIDFRELVKDLAARFRTRIEMRQVGVRDAAKVVGGLGICGRQLCCKTFLTSFEPISIRMAKSQELVLNANKLSGVCGRLMCCLSYEYSETEKIGDVAPEKAELPLLEEEGKIKSEVSQELSPSAEERPSERAKDRGRRRRYGSARPPAGEGEAKKSSGGQASQAGREDRRHKAVQGPPRDESQPVKAEPTAPQGESHDQQFQRRKRHGRRFRR